MNQSLNNELLVADLLLKVKAIENLLLRNNIFSEDELNQELKLVSNNIIASIIRATNSDPNLDVDAIIQDLDKHNNNEVFNK